MDFSKNEPETVVEETTEDQFYTKPLVTRAALYNDESMESVQEFMEWARRRTIYVRYSVDSPYGRPNMEYPSVNENGVRVWNSIRSGQWLVQDPNRENGQPFTMRDNQFRDIYAPAQQKEENN